VPHPNRLYFQKEELILGSASGIKFTLFLHRKTQNISLLTVGRSVNQ